MMVQLAILSRIAERRQQANVRHRFGLQEGFLLCRITQRAMLALVGLVALAPLCLLDEHATLLSEAQAEVARGGHVSSDTVASLRDAVAEDGRFDLAAAIAPPAAGPKTPIWLGSAHACSLMRSRISIACSPVLSYSLRWASAAM